MKTLFSRIGEFYNRMQLRNFVAMSLMAVMLLMTPAMPQIADASVDAGVKGRIDRLEARGEQGRPRTTGQFQAEKESLEGQPGEVVERMGKEFSDAVGEAAETVGQTVKDLVPGLEADGLTHDD